ncbi:hypothetical protein CYY_006499 [Polysphondylium violaceum]|uniref:glutathione gamma-glutamylcysteinyltransferase n=1 Tax=Polysphondylium violaceum TaxID=133409 RepID=A0A8J4V5W7_9MYCE|nr:hypothetical protein CYY_006499 [Polysphondylium violaceum]
MTEKPSFYKKPLPNSCIDYASEEGQIVFAEALQQGYLKSFFHLSQHFLTQAEPAYCGLSTLAMVLNTLGVDPGPGRQYKNSVWRWFTEEILDCCKALELVQEKGITINEFACLANCNGLETQIKFAPSSTVEEFRDLVKLECSTKDNPLKEILVVSYDRSGLGQTGTGHFSPIGAYNETRDIVLIFDVARFKYPPHWVSLEQLFKSMHSIDPDSGKSRGYITLKKKDNQSLCCSILKKCKEGWRDLISNLIHLPNLIVDSHVETINDLIVVTLAYLSKNLNCLVLVDYNENISKEIQTTKLYNIISNLNININSDNSGDNNTCNLNNNNCNSNNCYSNNNYHNINEIYCIILFSINSFLNEYIENIENIDLLKEPFGNENQFKHLVPELQSIKEIIDNFYTFCSNRSIIPVKQQ